MIRGASLAAGAEAHRRFAPDPRAELAAVTAAAKRFVQASGCRFDRSEIVGRTLADPFTHAAWVKGGGCAAILEAPATS
jgi:hypothetical protein